MQQLTKKYWKIIAIVFGAAVLLTCVIVWRVSASNAENKAAQLVTACADMVRCLAGDSAKFDKTSVSQGFQRRMVAELPDINTAKHCVLALDVVGEIWDSYQRIWFNSTSKKGSDGIVLGEKFQTAYNTFRTLPVNKSSDQVFLRKEKYGSVLDAGKIGFDLYQSASEMLINDGASDKQLTDARETRNRKAPQEPKRMPQGQTILTIDGTVKPANWNLQPSHHGLVLHALSDQGKMRLSLRTDNKSTWKQIDGPSGFAPTPDLEFRVIDAPQGKRFYVVAHGKAANTKRFIGKIEDSGVTKPQAISDATNDWKPVPGNEREAVVLDDDWIAYSVYRVVEKTAEDKKEEKKQREQWEKNYADKEVQALITLAEQRRVAYQAIGIDDDHKRVDGIAYIKQGANPQVLELSGLGIAGLIAHANPMLLVGEQQIPAHKLGIATIPLPGQPLGPLTEGGSLKPIQPSLHATSWHHCVSHDHSHWIPTVSGNFLIAMRPGMLDVVPMAALADKDSHLGCGDAVATVTLELKKDRIFANLLTVRGQQTEGAKIHITAGTNPTEFNQTVASAAASGTTVIGWIARGYALYTTNIKTDHEFGAPKILGEIGADSSTISGVRFVAQGSKLFAVLARQSCEHENQCKTSFEILSSDDGANTWK